MLDFSIDIPQNVQDGAPLIVLLHGRGSHKDDLMGLRPGLPVNAIIVTPQGPFSGANWGYGGGWAWYKFLGGTTPEPETFLAGQAEIETFLGELPSHLPIKPGPLILGGFSQGGTSALAYTLRHPGEIDGLLLFSGFLASHPTVQATPETVADTRFFWGHGTVDQMIPISDARPGRASLLAAGADLTTRDYPIGHWIEPAELRDASDWLTSHFFQPAPSATR
jgi:phospholipase/carboxylesterase